MDSTKKLTILLTAKDSASKSLGSFGRSIGELGKKAAKATLAIAAIGAAAAVAFSVKSVKAAIDLGESINAVEKTFGDASEKILEFGKTAAESAGLSKSAFNSATIPIGAMLQNMGMAADDAADETINLATRAADLSSVFNSDLSESLVAIQSGLRGESEPLKRFGVDLSQTAVQAYALSEGLITQGEELNGTALATARLGQFMEQTSKFQGDFADTSGDAANKQRILEARMENMSATIGEKLLPVWKKLLDFGDYFISNVMPVISRGVDNLKDKFREWTPRLIEVKDQIINIATQVGDYLQPKLQALWSTISEKLIPALADFWKSYLEPLIPVIGVLLVGAIGAALDVLNFTIVAFATLGQWMSDNEPIVLGFAAAFGILKGAMIFNAVVNAIIVQFNIIKLVQIPQLMASFTALKVAIATPMVLPAILIGAALAAIWKVRDEGIKLQKVLSEVNRTTATLGDAREDYGRSLNARLDRGEITKAERNRLWIASDPQKAHGGGVEAGKRYIAGERGGEVFVPDQKGSIVKNMDAERMMGGSSVSIYGNITIQTPAAADRFFDRLDRSGKITSMGLTGARA